MDQRKRSISRLKRIPDKGRASRSRKRSVAPRTTEQFFAKPERFQDAWTRLTSVLAKMRSANLSLKQASREVGISPKTVTRLSGSALKKGPNGRYSVKPTDQLLRVLKVPTPHGSHEIGVRGSKQASLLGQYWAAVHKYLATGDASGVEKFRGKQIKDATGAIIPLLTDLKALSRQGSAGVLSFESLYARSA
jgi:hypothetical protein